MLTPRSRPEVELYIPARTWLVVRRDIEGESTRYADFRNIDSEPAGTFGPLARIQVP